MNRFDYITVFKKYLLKEIQPDHHPVYNMCKPIDLKLLSRLRLGLCHSNEYRFNHYFKTCFNPLCTCSLEAETTSHFSLHCHYYHPIRLALFNEIFESDMNLPNLSEEKFLNVILYGSSLFSDIESQSILNSSIKYKTESNYISESVF